MRRIFALILVCCLVLGITPALAAITITKQPESQTVKAGGNLKFTVKAKGVGDSPVTWYFTNPETGEVVTGRNLSGSFAGLKVQNPNNLTITLKKVPKEMHGWTAYCHIGPKGSGVNSDLVMVLIAGLEVPEMPTPTPSPTPEIFAATPVPSAQEISGGPVIITGSKVDLFRLDKKGNLTGTAQRELVFDENETVNFYVRIPEGTEGTIQYVTVGSLRLTPDGEVTGMSIRGLTSNATVKIKVKKPVTEEEAAKAKEEEAPVDESSLVTVTCTNCRFTGWHNTYAVSGQVPVGSTIKVAAAGGLLKRGYSINGGAAEHKNEASFTLVVEGDTTISMEKKN